MGLSGVSVRQQVSTERMRRAEDWYAYCREQARLDEATDAAERLAAPMHTTFDYFFDTDGRLCFDGEPIEPVFLNGIDAAEAMVTQNPSLSFELERRRLELDEHYDSVRFAMAADDTEDVMVVISPVPAEVKAGSIIDGYNRERMKTMVRVYERISGGVRVRSLSLDKSDRDGIAAVAHAFGGTISMQMTDRDILAERHLAYRYLLAQPPEVLVRQAYDAVLTSKYGGKWFAGRQNDAISNTYDFICSHPVLLTRHMDELERIGLLDVDESRMESMRDRARYDFAAALSEIMEGRTSQHDVDMGAAGQRAKAEGKNFDGDCPTGAASASQAVEIQLGRTETIHARECPQCKSKNITYQINGERINGSCGCWKDICTGDSYTAKRTQRGVSQPATNGYVDGVACPRASQKAEKRPGHGQPDLRRIDTLAIGGMKTTFVDQSGRQYDQQGKLLSD